jgi:hypothetical protein
MIEVSALYPDQQHSTFDSTLTKSTRTILGVLRVCLLIGIVLSSPTGLATPVVIDFEDLPAGPIGTGAQVFVTDQYAFLGITFNGPAALDYSEGSVVAIPNFAHSGTKAIEQCYAIEFCTRPIEVSFREPQRRVEMWVGFSEFFVGRTETFTALLSAFDADGREVGRATTTLVVGSQPIPIRTPLEVISPDVNIVRAALRLLLPDGSLAPTNGLAVDDVEFDTAGRPLATTFGPPSSSNRSGTAVEPINTATGNYFFQPTDLVIPARGLSVIFTRTYNSMDASGGPLGPGWTHSYNVFLTERGDGSVAIKLGDGHQEFYDALGGAVSASVGWGFQCFAQECRWDVHPHFKGAA